jgi:DNA-binding NarL/FixJ family response regulator
MRNMDNKRVSTLVVAKPGLMRNSLLAFLRATPGVDIVALVDNATTALQMARILRPAVLLVDTNLAENDVLVMIRELRAEQPAVRSIVLSESIQEQQQSLQVGASHALIKGFLDDRLRQAILYGTAHVQSI